MFLGVCAIKRNTIEYRLEGRRACMMFQATSR
jgi:hypothetical protein